MKKNLLFFRVIFFFVFKNQIIHKTQNSNTLHIFLSIQSDDKTRLFRLTIQHGMRDVLLVLLSMRFFMFFFRPLFLCASFFFFFSPVSRCYIFGGRCIHTNERLHSHICKLRLYE